MSRNIPVTLSSVDIRNQMMDDYENFIQFNNPKKIVMNYIEYLQKQLDETYNRHYERYGYFGYQKPEYTQFLKDKHNVVCKLLEGLERKRGKISGIFFYLEDTMIHISTPPENKTDLLHYFDYIDREFDHLYKKYHMTIEEVPSVPILSHDNSIVIITSADHSSLSDDSIQTPISSNKSAQVNLPLSHYYAHKMGVLLSKYNCFPHNTK